MILTEDLLTTNFPIRIISVILTRIILSDTLLHPEPLIVNFISKASGITGRVANISV